VRGELRRAQAAGASVRRQAWAQGSRGGTGGAGNGWLAGCSLRAEARRRQAAVGEPATKQRRIRQAAAGPSTCVEAGARVAKNCPFFL
jgi:hypothetical protein